MAVKASSPNLINQSNVFFRRNDFDAAIWKKGFSVIVERALRCPCQTKNNAPLLDCENCNSTGYVFVSPIQTKALIHSINFDQKIKEWSPENIGTVSISVRGDVERLNFMDRVTVVNDNVTENKIVYSEVLTVRGNIGSEFIFCSYKPIGVTGIFVFNGSDKALYFLDATTFSVSENNPYVINFDFDFSSIENYSGVVSILYTTQVQYNIIDIPHSLRTSYKINNSGQEEQIILPVNGIGRLTNNVMNIADYNGNGIQTNDVPIGAKKWILVGGKWKDSGVFSNKDVWVD